ncbi:unnamed protein product [Pieris macdunnoughi]|uniref:Reverse transcriptase domain-containing protein n=1 Tax=Pieris macdunnoughi TaxID=345717 RepID=A0A821LHF5_9NEOP|nr:unnamed protein product [Pieris macdunnoughi]
MAQSKLSDRDELALLVRKRGTIKARLTVFKDFLGVIDQIEIDNITSKNISDINVRLTKIKELFSDFEKVQSEIEELDLESNLDKRLNERIDIESQFFAVMSSAQEIVSKRDERVEAVQHRLSLVSNSSNNNNNSHLNNQIRLPTIKLPTFDGNYLKWLEFRDTFDSLINANDTLPDISKFHYLRSSLEGGAVVTIKSIEFTSENYLVAWELLCNRYNNKNVLINNHLKSLFSLESLNRESHRSLRYIIDHVSKNLRALNTLGEHTDKWDSLVIYIVVQKLDSVTSIKWEEYKLNLGGSIELEDFYQFLRQRADILETVQGGSRAVQVNRNERFVSSKEPRHIKTFFSSTPNGSCFMCNENHRVYKCDQFKNLSIEAREAEVSKRKLCSNCLRPGHSTSNCRLSSCRACNKKHNSLLCHNNNSVNKVLQNESNLNLQTNEVKQNTNHEKQNLNTVASTSTVLTTLTSYSSNSEVLLGTAVVEVVVERDNSTYLARVLLDCGSQSSFVTDNLKNKLKIKTNSTKSRCISGLNNSISTATEYCTLKLKSRINAYTTDVHCMIISNISENLPSVEIDPEDLNIPNNTALADPSFHKSNKVDILIGSDVMWNIVKGGCQISLGENKPKLIYSKFGWLVSGPMTLAMPSVKCNKKSVCHFSQEIKDSLSKFWDLENFIMPKRSLSTDEQICEDSFNENTIRLPSGRFQVKMPLRESPEALGDSYSLAKRCFLNLERRFQKQPKLKEMYSDFIHEYATLGHLTEIEKPPIGNYLPHHAVLREKSETTKLRVVFNGSARTASGKSLNDIQYVGPVVQNDLMSILLRFRQHKYVLTGDIEKMFRQVKLDESQRHLQLILWRDNEAQPLRTLQLNTVTYGTASAPYLTTRCLVQLSTECSDKRVANTIKNDFYCDDLITGCDNKTELKYLRDAVVDKLAEACLPLRKFRTNIPSIFASESISTTCTEKDLSQTNDQYSNLQNQSSVLGLNWCPSQDKLYFSVDFQIEQPFTKRTILAATCKIFDPLGLLSACTIVPKMLLQRLWESKLDWDDLVSADVSKQWSDFVNNLNQIKAINIPRHVLHPSSDTPVSVELHCFVDSSQSAFAACVFIRCTYQEDNVSVKLLCAKARVAPLKPSTIPRLELAAALLGAQLSSKVCQSLSRKFDQKYFWSDSTIVLGWIKNTNPSNLKQFVYNRVNEIHELTDKSTWHHISTEMNPADIASRGVSPSKLQDLELWWSGPPFLMKPKTEWPSAPIENVELPELKVYSCCVSAEHSFEFDRFSKFQRMIRVVGYILRFIHNCKTKKDSRLSGDLSNDEIDRSTQTLIKTCQQDSFPNEGWRQNPKLNL